MPKSFIALLLKTFTLEAFIKRATVGYTLAC